MFEASVVGEEATGCNCREDVGCAKDVVDLRLASVIGGGNGRIGVLVFVDVEEVVLGGEVFPRVLALGKIQASVGVDQEDVVFVVVTERGE